MMSVICVAVLQFCCITGAVTWRLPSCCLYDFGGDCIHYFVVEYMWRRVLNHG